MKKIFLLSLLLIPATTHGMEKFVEGIEEAAHTLHDKLFGSEEELFTPDPNSPLADKVQKLDDALYADKNWPFDKEDDIKYLVICRYPEHPYGYVENNGKEYYKPLGNYTAQEFAEMQHLKSARYEGISAMGVLILGVQKRHTRTRDAKKIMHNFYGAGMQPTKEDQDLATYFGKTKLLNRD